MLVGQILGQPWRATSVTHCESSQVGVALAHQARPLDDLDDALRGGGRWRSTGLYCARRNVKKDRRGDRESRLADVIGKSRSCGLRD